MHRGDWHAAYRRLSAAAEELVRADRELGEYVRRVRLSHGYLTLALAGSV